MTPTRRTVLRGGVLGGLLLAAAGAGLALQPGRLREPSKPLRALDARTFSVLAAVADRVCPGGRGLPSASELGVPERVDALLDALDPGNAADLSQALRLIENGLPGLLLDGRPRAFTACDPATQDRVLERWRTSRLTVRRTAWKALVALISSAYWSDARTFGFVGYPGPPRFPDAP